MIWPETPAQVKMDAERAGLLAEEKQAVDY
jgi:hypothetical protein